MLSQKTIIAGILILIVLAGFYIGNQVMRTTPQTSAKGIEYKVVPLLDESSAAAYQAAMQGKSPAEQYMAQFQIYQDRLNSFGSEGWELVAIHGTSPMEMLILKKN